MPTPPGFASKKFDSEEEKTAYLEGYEYGYDVGYEEGYEEGLSEHE